MGAQDVRKAIVAYLAPPAIPGLNSVFRGQPVTMVGQDWPIGVDNGWGATAYVQVSEQSERRIAMGGGYVAGSIANTVNGGLKRVKYTISLVLLWRWAAASFDPGETTDEWTDPYDGFIDDVRAKIRADRTFGCGSAGPIFQAGEGVDADEDDIRTLSDLPRFDEGQVVVWTALEFNVVEIVNT